MLARSPWENEPILICGVSLTHRVYPPSQEAFAMAGTSAIDGDILCHVSGTTTVNVFYPEGTGFLFPGHPSECHIDVHAWSGTGQMHEVWLTLYYYKSLEHVPVATPIPRPNNDKLPEIARLHSVYEPVPPAPHRSSPPPPPPMPKRIAVKLLALARRRKPTAPQPLRASPLRTGDG